MFWDGIINFAEFVFEWTQKILIWSFALWYDIHTGIELLGNTAQELHNSPFLKQIQESHNCSISPGTRRMDGFYFCSASLSSIYKVKLHYLGTSYFNFCMDRLLFSSIFVKKGWNGAGFCLALPGDVSCLSRKLGKSMIRQVCTFAILLCSCSADCFVRDNNIREMTLRGKPHIYLVSKLC